MKRLGLIGGTSWESTAHYYRLLNEEAKRRLGGLHSADLLIRSVDFAPIATLQHEENWDAVGDALAEEARRLEGAGAEAILICANTMHLVAPAIEARIAIPVINIIDAAAQAVKAAGMRQPLLLGTRFTMEHGFYENRMAEHGVELRIPDAAGRALLHRVIFDELCLGVVREESRALWTDLVADHVARGADSVIFGCTEIGMLLDPAALPALAFDTAELHCRAGMDWALAD